MPRLVRRRPLHKRILALLNPVDYLLLLSEDIEAREWDSKQVGSQLGLLLNFVFLVGRANLKRSTIYRSDDIFGDSEETTWFAFILYPLLCILAAFSVTNAIYTFARKRQYRLFEANIEVQPSTPSARRVKVQSPPFSSSPLRYIADLMTPESAESRAHPDRDQDVWQIAVWDPPPVALQLVCFFSPLHVLVYLLFLPVAPLDARPSVTVFNALVIEVLLSAQLLLLCSQFSQQAKDTAIIQKEVMHEYDTKFVHPLIYPTVRDVGTQKSQHQPVMAREFVELGTPTTLIRRTLVSRGTSHVGESRDMMPTAKGSSSTMNPHMSTPTGASLRSSALRNSLPAPHTPRAAQATDGAVPPTQSHDFGGYMGVYTHNKSPLKKATSLSSFIDAEVASPRNSREMAAWEQRRRELPSSPTKKPDPRQVLGAGVNSSPHPFANMGKHRPQYERYPSRR
ncbi:hypothetical protein CDD81_5947 [Ophiocordyceps australis]|uniref:Meiotically up-regulated gene 154 protein n=1 Tax=Ophiocordyceps australis TaxID=1399860 RepID=A0A2C5YBE2_9HYPO|nr:hypothetical protein CDD81_5947 [Ophiocordyceps australis]